MERKLTEEQREHIEALIKASAHLIGRLEMKLQRMKMEKKGYEVFLRDYGQPVLLAPDGSDAGAWGRDGSDKSDGVIREICAACDRAEEENLHTLMAMKQIECMGLKVEVE